MEVILTVADHEENGFVHIARWTGHSEQSAREFVSAVDASVDPEAEPDIKSAPFTFILDIFDPQNWNLIDTGKRQLPLQIAMGLGGDHVRRWLDERPDPDAVIHRYVPVVATHQSPGGSSDRQGE
jgi:hypothetical protein